jgi:hypothetical protein
MEFYIYHFMLQLSTTEITQVFFFHYFHLLIPFLVL